MQLRPPPPQKAGIKWAEKAVAHTVMACRYITTHVIGVSWVTEKKLGLRKPQGKSWDPVRPTSWFTLLLNLTPIFGGTSIALSASVIGARVGLSFPPPSFLLCFATCRPIVLQAGPSLCGGLYITPHDTFKQEAGVSWA